MSSPPRRRVVEAPPRKKPPAELRAIRIVFEADPEPDASYLSEAPELGARRRDYEKGTFTLVVVRAEAEVVIEETTQVLTSPGLGGIESDTDEEDLNGVIAEEWLALRKVLTAVGVPTSQLPIEVDRAWVEWRT